MPTTTEAPIVLVGPANYATLCTQGRAMLLEAGYTLIENPHDRPLEPQEVLEWAPRISAGIVGIESWDAGIIDASPDLQVLTKLGVGVDNIDLESTRARGIDVANAPGGNANAVAEMAVGLILAALRSIPQQYASSRAGGWARYVGTELSGKRLGLIGFGAIGALLAHRLSGFDLVVNAYDPYPNLERAKSLGVELGSLEWVLQNSDVVSLHVPSLPSTRHIMNDETLALMVPGSYLVNTARGALVDEAALVRALESGHLGGAALDVFETEPIPADHPLLSLANVVSTSHGAADSIEAYEAIGVINATAIIDRLSGRAVKNIANPASAS